MKVNYNGAEYRLHFEYETFNRRRWTSCIVTEAMPAYEPVTVAFGQVKCHPGDEYKKSVGRWEALKAAMIHIEDRELRKLLYQAYKYRGELNGHAIIGSTGHCEVQA